jgi:hypothetical protein
MSASLDDIERGQRAIMQQTRNSAKRNADDYRTGDAIIIEFFSLQKIWLPVLQRITFCYAILEVLLNAFE